MTIDPRSFMQKLATWMAAAAAIEHAGTPRGLFLWNAIEKDAATTFSVLQVYGGGEVPWVGVPVLPIQCKTTGSDPAAWTQAQKLFNTLFDATSGLPVRNATIDSQRVIGFTNIRVPALIGRDEQGRAQIVFNFDAQAVFT